MKDPGISTGFQKIRDRHLEDGPQRAGTGSVVRIVYAYQERCHSIAYLNSPLGLPLTICAAAPSVT